MPGLGLGLGIGRVARGRRGGTSVAQFTLTCTTTGAGQTLTLQGLTVASGKTVRVDWGDGTYNDYTGGGARTHVYDVAGAYSVCMSKSVDITALDLRDTKLSGTISATNPMPTGLTSLALNSLSGLTWTVGASAPMPASLTTLSLNSLSGLTWIITTGNQWPTGATAMTVIGCPAVTVTTWTNNSIRTIQAENAYSQANVNAFLYAILANKANFTYATPALDLLGGSNAAPSGTYQAADPVTSGKEAAYALVNGNGSYAAGPEWTVQTA